MEKTMLGLVTNPDGVVALEEVPVPRLGKIPTHPMTFFSRWSTAVSAAATSTSGVPARKKPRRFSTRSARLFRGMKLWQGSGRLVRKSPG